MTSYQPYSDPAEPYPAGYGYPPPPTSGWVVRVSPKSVSGLAIALKILLVLTGVISILKAYGWWHEYALLGDIQRDPYSVSVAAGRSADNLVQAADVLWVLMFVATAVVFLIWFFRARFNAAVYGNYPQRRAQGWAIGGWFCPFIALVYPYQMTVDVLAASELRPGATPRPPRRMRLLKAWWGIWLIGNVLGLAAAVHVSPADISTLKTHAVILALSAVVDIVAAVLVFAVIARITNAQERRQPTHPAW